MGDGQYGISPDFIERIAGEIREVHATGCQLEIGRAHV